MSALPAVWLERARSLVSSLPDVLSWSSGPDINRSVRDLHRAWMDARLEWCSRESGMPIADRINALPERHRDRLLQAPMVFFLVRPTREPGLKELAAINRFIDVEEHLCNSTNGASASVPPDAWSALGDRRADSGDASSATRGIVVDTRSPHLEAYPHNPYIGSAVLYSPEELPVVLAALEGGFAQVESVSGDALRLIESMVSVIATVRGATSGEMTSSGSERRLVGLMTIANLHSDAWSPVLIADALVHEAIHSLLYRIELAECLNPDQRAALRAQVESPWSGRTLAFHSFMHACFVWFGLWNFWRLSGSTAVECVELRDMAQKGFLGRTLASVLPAPLLENIQPHVRLTVDRMFERVNALT